MCILVNSRTILVLFSALLFPFLCNSATAQTTSTGALAGVVTDPSNAVVPDAAVEIIDSAKGTSQTTKTNREGVYRFFFLAPGKYMLRVKLAGFQETTRDAVVLLGPPMTVNITLEIAKASAIMKVTGETPLIQAENGDVSTTIDEKQISELPNPGNDLTYIVQTTPGVIMNTNFSDNANFSLLGMPGTSYLFTLDGMNNTNSENNFNLAGALGLLLGLNQIQETTVVNTGYSGQFGGAAGGNINYLTKSGSNAFHGNAQYYWNGQALNASNSFDVANQWAASLGGPIKKNELFFFADTEGMRLALPQLFVVSIPSPEFEAATMANIDKKFGPASASDAFYKKIFDLYNAAPGASSAVPGGFSSDDPLGCSKFIDPNDPNGLGKTIPCSRHFIADRSRPSQDALMSGRLDWDVNGKNRVFFRVQYDGGHSSAITDPISPAFDADFTNPWWQGQVNWTRTFDSSAASQFLAAGSYLAPILALKNTSQGLAAFPTSLHFTQGPFTPLADADWFVAYGFGRHETHLQISEDVMKTRGSHKFGFGAGFERTYWTFLGYTNNSTGILSAETLDAFYQGGVDPASPDVNYSQLFQFFYSAPSERITFYNFGIYGQDEWHARPNLVLTFSLRAEYKSNPACKDLCFARLDSPFNTVSHDPDQPYNQTIRINQRQVYPNTDTVLWSPRASFAWQPLGLSGGTVIRGGIGIFYDSQIGDAAYLLSQTSPLVNIFTVVKNNLTPQEQTSLFKDASTSNTEFLNGFSTGKTLAEIQATDPNFFPPGITVPPRTMHFPQYQKWSLEWQQAFGNDTSFSIGYYGHHGIHELVENFSANAYGFGSLPPGLCTSPPVLPCADPRFGQVLQMRSDAVSNYNGMVASLKHRFTGWSQGFLSANYTFGHAFDEVSNGGDYQFNASSALNSQDPNNLRGAYGPADYDVRHSFNANYVWELPLEVVLRGHGSDSLVKGWQVAGTVIAQSGFPYTVFDFATSSALNQNNYFGSLYAVPVRPLNSGGSCGHGAVAPLAPKPCQPPQTLPDQVTPNPGAHFVQAGCETGFNTGHLGAFPACDGPEVSFSQGRNQFRGPAFVNTDFSVMKYTGIPRWESATLGIGFQFFNFFNHRNLFIPDNGISSSSFGQIPFSAQGPTSLLGKNLGGNTVPRMIQLKAQIRF